MRHTGAIAGLTAQARRALLVRDAVDDDMVRTTVAAIVDLVRRDGDDALRSLAREYDQAKLTGIEVPMRDCEKALDAIPKALRQAMERSVRNIASAHRAFVPVASETETEPGILVGRRPDPLSRVGVYAPGGRAAYPSSLLMGVIPAKVAGVGEVVVCSPPASSGKPSAVVLAAAALAGADRVFASGGAGAVAAMAFGTATIPRVDRIVGPGNAFVTEAKLQVSNVVSIDSPAGPSELLVIADGSTDLRVVAREILAQAEHDPRACVVVVLVGGEQRDDMELILDGMASGYARLAIIKDALSSSGAMLTAASLDEAVAFANAYAPEHLLLAVEDPMALLPSVRNAGTVFLGETSSVSFGDYMSGANHVLPTGGLARSYSGLSTQDFVRWTTYQRIDRGAASRLAEDVGVFAESERLEGHAAAARQWKGEP